MIIFNLSIPFDKQQTEGLLMKRYLRKIILAILLSLTIIIPNFVFADYESYVAYSLPRLKGDNYTNVHDKQTNDNYIKNQVTALDNTDSADFWVVTQDGTRISDNYNQKVTNYPITINFRPTIHKYKGDQIKMGMQNARLSTGYAFVSGKVDFR